MSILPFRILLTIQAGFSKGSIYHHFKLKEDTLVAVTDRMIFLRWLQIFTITRNFFSVFCILFIRKKKPVIGKVIAVILTVSMCAQPLGNAFYGILFEICKGFEYAVVLFSGVVSLMIAISTRNIFKRLSAEIK